jgi:Family of unknown function (DUF5837)
MDKKNLIFQATQPANNSPIQDLPIELVELSEEVLSQVWGGSLHYAAPWQPDDLCCTCVWNPPDDPLPPLDPFDFGDVILFPFP